MSPVKVNNFNVPEEVIRDRDSVEQLIHDDDEKTRAFENVEDEASNLDDIPLDGVSMGGGTNTWEEGKNMDMKALYGGVLHIEYTPNKD
ncbi:hypothetical protein HHK36_015595 [Tetracentron sinense]|uniref:Uncharacterized protein n=1 Tax=Tetracentron sinense TaxID=13715 RepID=A0A835DGX4_TETSI|nr:hypothetical protein HHK36_015595 [Tetracentron sinense]